MADEIIPRRSRKPLDGSGKLPDPNSLLKNTQAPEFLQNKNESKFIEKETTKKVSAPPTELPNVISKGAEIVKPLVRSEANAEAIQKYNNFINYMELRALAGEDNEEIYARLPKGNTNEDIYRNDPYSLDKPPQDIAGGLDVKSKGIKKSNKQNSIKEKEKARRMKGQSSISTWKPDLFMKLRQEYD